MDGEAAYSLSPPFALRFSESMIATICFGLVTFGPPGPPLWSVPDLNLSGTSLNGIWHLQIQIDGVPSHAREFRDGQLRNHVAALYEIERDAFHDDPDQTIVADDDAATFRIGW